MLADFEADRSRLFSMAYRMTGSAADAEDILQATWLRAQTSAPSEVQIPLRVADHRHGTALPGPSPLCLPQPGDRVPC